MSNSLEVADAAGKSHRLRPNAIGVFGILFFVLSAQAPLTGIAGGAPLSIGIGDGAGAPGAYLVVGIVITIFAVGFIAMSRHVKDAGAFYAYIGKGLGRSTGTGSAMVALLSYGTIQAAMYGLYGVVASGLLQQHLGWTVAWWVCALVTMAVVQAGGAIGIDLGARVLAVLVACEITILLAFALAVLFSNGGPDGLQFTQSFAPSHIVSGSPGIAIMFAIASMFGFESTAIYAEEAKDPVKTIPRATYLSVIVIAAFFAFVMWMLVSYYGAAHAANAAGHALGSGDSTAFLFNAVGDKLGSWAATALGWLLATSLLAGILAFHNGINRYVFSLGHHGTLPRAVSRVNKNHAPWVAGCVQTALAVALVIPFAINGSDPVLTLFSWFSGVAVLALMLLYLLTSASVVVYFRRTDHNVHRWQTLIAPVVATVLIAGVTYIIIVNFTTLIGGEQSTAVWLMLTVPVLFVLGFVYNRLTHGRRGVDDAEEPTMAAPQIA